MSSLFSKIAGIFGKSEPKESPSRILCNCRLD